MNFCRNSFFMLLLLLLVSTVKLKAQSPATICGFTTDTVITGYGQTFSNKLKLENRSDKTIVLTKGTSTEASLLKLPDTVLLIPGAIKYIPVKFISSESLFSKPLKFI